MMSPSIQSKYRTIQNLNNVTQQFTEKNQESMEMEYALHHSVCVDLM